MYLLEWKEQMQAYQGSFHYKAIKLLLFLSLEILKPLFDFGDNEIISLNNSPHGLNRNFLVKLKTLISFFKCIKYLNSIEDDYVISSYPRTSILFAIFQINKVIAHEHSSFNAHSKFLQYLRLWLYKKFFV